MKRSIAIITTIAIVAVITSIFLWPNSNREVADEPWEGMEEIEIEPEVVEEIQESYIDSLERDIPMDLSEAGVQNLIHWMSHQKIAADTKWGHFEITQERVERLLEVVKINDYEHQDIYLDILQRWVVGDFSQAVEDHNRIWTLQGGTVGKATRLLTPEEEQAYINYHFRRDAVTEEEENGEP